MGLFQAFGLDIKLLIANFVNFVILVAILYKLGYKPILKFVRERQEKIAKGLSDAEDAAKHLNLAAKEKKVVLMKAHQEAQEIISRAREQALIQAKGILEKTRAEAKHIVERAKKEIREQQAQSVTEVRRGAVSVAFALAEKLLRRNIDARADEMFIKNSLKELK